MLWRAGPLLLRLLLPMVLRRQRLTVLLLLLRRRRQLLLRLTGRLQGGGRRRRRCRGRQQLLQGLLRLRRLHMQRPRLATALLRELLGPLLWRMLLLLLQLRRGVACLMLGLLGLRGRLTVLHNMPRAALRRRATIALEDLGRHRLVAVPAGNARCAISVRLAGSGGRGSRSSLAGPPLPLTLAAARSRRLAAGAVASGSVADRLRAPVGRALLLLRCVVNGCASGLLLVRGVLAQLLRKKRRW